MIRRLIVNWQHEATREILPVAELLVTTGDKEMFEFGYLEGVREALAKGFQPFLAFPSLDRRYESRALFPFFQNRVLPTTRPDYAEYVAALGLDQRTANVVDLLGRSEARRQTDRIEMVLVADRDAAGGRYVTRFLVRGVRHVGGAEEAVRRLHEGAVLRAVPDPTNPHTTRARELRFGEDLIGFVPSYLLDDMDALEGAEAGPTFTVERVNPPPHPARYRVLVRLDAAWPQGFEPFCADRFQPLRAASADAPASDSFPISEAGARQPKRAAV